MNLQLLFFEWKIKAAIVHSWQLKKIAVDQNISFKIINYCKKYVCTGKKIPIGWLSIIVFSGPFQYLHSNIY